MITHLFCITPHANSPGYPTKARGTPAGPGGVRPRNALGGGPGALFAAGGGGRWWWGEKQDDDWREGWYGRNVKSVGKARSGDHIGSHCTARTMRSLSHTPSIA